MRYEIDFNNLPKSEGAQHTPGPWYEANMGNDHQGLIIDEATGRNIAVTYEKEHAAFIVRACSSHEELVEALRSLVLWRDNDPDFIESVSERGNEIGSTALEHELYERARAALRKAGAL